MPRLTVQGLLAKLEHTFIIRAAAVIFGFGMLLSSLTLILWAAFFQSQTKIIAGINYYTFPVKVTFADNTTQVNPFESYNFSTAEFGPLQVEVTDLDGNILTTRRHEFSRQAAIAIDVLSDNNTAKLCFAQANVTNLFYESSLEGHLITEIKSFTDVAAHTFLQEVPAVTDTTLYPGNYAGTHLPPQIDQQQKVWGIYPIDCNNANDPNKVAMDIILRTTELPETQRQLYAEKLQEIFDSPEYNH